MTVLPPPCEATGSPGARHGGPPLSWVTTLALSQDWTRSLWRQEVLALRGPCPTALLVQQAGVRGRSPRESGWGDTACVARSEGRETQGLEPAMKRPAGRSVASTHWPELATRCPHPLGNRKCKPPSTQRVDKGLTQGHQRPILNPGPHTAEDPGNHPLLLKTQRGEDAHPRSPSTWTSGLGSALGFRLLVHLTTPPDLSGSSDQRETGGLWEREREAPGAAAPACNPSCAGGKTM